MPIETRSENGPVPSGALHTYADEHLMLLLREGLDAALAQLVERYQNDVFRFCLHYLRNIESAKETAQETFLRVYVARARFDVNRVFKPWLLCIARNLCLNEIKRGKIVPMDSLEGLAEAGSNAARAQAVSHAPIADEALMARERQSALARILDGLPAESREIVTMRFFEHMQARDIAEVIGSTEGAVRTRLHRILKDLRAQCAPLKEQL